MRARAGRLGCSGISVTKPWRVGLLRDVAEYLAKGENPRFIVTSLSRQEFPKPALYPVRLNVLETFIVHAAPLLALQQA